MVILIQNSKIGNSRNLEVNMPNVCPHCHVTIIPAFKFAIQDSLSNELFCSLMCTNSACERLFFVSYIFDGHLWVVAKLLNGFPKGPDWPEPIINLKDGSIEPGNEIQPSKFIETYLQSLKAESEGLFELSGMGFRKALEYLVKDWAIQNKPEAREGIIKTTLGNVVNQNYEGDLKDILSRATWLGNDQAHYLRVYEEFDVETIKELIAIIMVELDRTHRIKHYNSVIERKTHK